jgi:hypothetical protein
VKGWPPQLLAAGGWDFKRAVVPGSGQGSASFDAGRRGPLYLQQTAAVYGPQGGGTKGVPLHWQAASAGSQAGNMAHLNVGPPINGALWRGGRVPGTFLNA